MPDWPRQAIGVLAIGGWLAVLAVAALRVRRRWNGQREWSRKLVHIGCGAVVPIAWAAGIDRLVAIPAAAAITLLAAINHRVRVIPAIEDVGRHSYGTIAYGAAITSLLLLFWPAQPQVVCAGVLVLALGDGLAGLLGPAWPSPQWRIWGQTKSLLGTTAMAAASLLALLLVAQVAAAVGLAAPGPAGLLAITAAAVLLEQLAVLGIDNVSVPLGVALLWHLWPAPG